MALTIGVDVGGTKIAAGLVDEAGTILADTRVESPAGDSDAMVEAVAAAVEKVRDREVAAVGVGAAGFVRRDRATVVFAPNLPWRDLDLRARLEQRLELPVVVENDANAAAWGEFRFGAGADVDDLLLVTVGTGVGGGLVLDGELHRGAFGLAAEIGHLRVERDGRACPCGQRGCLERYASGSALVADTRRLAATDPEAAALLARVGGTVESLDGPAITEAALAGDAFAIARLRDLGGWLGEGIAGVAAVVDPGTVVIGGGVSAAGELLRGPAATAYAAHLTGAGNRPIADVRLATLGNRAGLVGAADLARHRSS